MNGTLNRLHDTTVRICHRAPSPQSSPPGEEALRAADQMTASPGKSYTYDDNGNMLTRTMAFSYPGLFSARERNLD